MNNAPWTPERVAALNAEQRREDRHPMTCGNNRSDDAHRAYAATHGDNDYGVLVATPDGWLCPVCGYKQKGL